MPRKRSVLSKNSDFVYQIIDSLITSISEHKWKDASLLLPSVVALSRRKISPYFIWKILHAVMNSTNIPLAVQIQILQITLKSSAKNYELILDMLSYKFEVINEQDFETFYESINESQRTKDSRDLLKNMCLSYYALFHYLKWKRLIINMQDQSSFEEKVPVLMGEEKRKLLGKLAFKAHALLNKVFSLFQMSEIIDSKGEYREKSIPCEWLLGPLLDIEVYTKMEENIHKNKKKVHIDFHGLELIENYVKSFPHHIPALRSFYFYLIAHHSQEEALIFEVLEKLVALSPESSLVLQYINLLSRELLVIVSSQEGNKKSKLKGCHLGSANLETLLKCLKLLTHFIEYRRWRKDVRAWKVFKDILIVFHESWISCWNCDDCVSSRSQMEHFSDSLSSWSDFIWHEKQLQLITLEDAELLVYMGYISFVLGYSESIARKAIECLENLKCQNEAINLLDLMRQKGSHMRDFLVYLLHQRKKRNIATNQDDGTKSKNYSVGNIEVNYSSSKIKRKNYFAQVNQPCLATDENSRSEILSEEEYLEENRDGSCNRANSFSKSNKIITNSKITFGRKRKLSNEDSSQENKKQRRK